MSYQTSGTLGTPFREGQESRENDSVLCTCASRSSTITPPKSHGPPMRSKNGRAGAILVDLGGNGCVVYSPDDAILGTKACYFNQFWEHIHPSGTNRASAVCEVLSNHLQMAPAIYLCVTMEKRRMGLSISSLARLWVSPVVRSVSLLETYEHYKQHSRLGLVSGHSVSHNAQCIVNDGVNPY